MWDDEGGAPAGDPGPRWSVPAQRGAEPGPAVELDGNARPGAQRDLPRGGLSEEQVSEEDGSDEQAGPGTARRLAGPALAAQAGRALDDVAVDGLGAVLVSAHGHEVTLVGGVQTEGQSSAAAGVVDGLPGVDLVTNQIVVVPDPTSRRVRDAVVLALVHTPGLRRDAITVIATPGRGSRSGGGREVTLEGWVRTESERVVVLAATASAPGVVAVTDRLQVRC